MKVLRFTVLLAMAALFSSCASAPVPQNPQEPPAPTMAPAPQREPAPEPVISPPALSLDGPSWVLDYLYDSGRIPTPPDGEVWIAFVREPDLITLGSSGTNGFSGGLDITASNGSILPLEESDTPLPLSGRLSFKPLVSTRRAGPFLDYEQKFFEMLGLVKGFTIEGDSYENGRLILHGGYGREEIELLGFYSKEPQPENLE